MELESYSLAEVLAVASIHPFYNSTVEYPPDAGAILEAQVQAAEQTAGTPGLRLQPLLWKKDL